MRRNLKKLSFITPAMTGLRKQLPHLMEDEDKGWISSKHALATQEVRRTRQRAVQSEAREVSTVQSALLRSRTMMCTSLMTPTSTRSDSGHRDSGPARRIITSREGPHPWQHPIRNARFRPFGHANLYCTYVSQDYLYYVSQKYCTQLKLVGCGHHWRGRFIVC